MGEDTNSVNLQALFLEHAAGMMTKRALRERQTRILRYMSRNKFTMQDDEFRILHAELDEIEKALEE